MNEQKKPDLCPDYKGKFIQSHSRYKIKIGRLNLSVNGSSFPLYLGNELWREAAPSKDRKLFQKGLICYTPNNYT